jgi:hypothetical protein
MDFSASSSYINVDVTYTSYTNVVAETYMNVDIEKESSLAVNIKRERERSRERTNQHMNAHVQQQDLLYTTQHDGLGA